MTDRTVELAGTRARPALLVRFNPSSQHPNGRPLLDWVRAMPGRKWLPQEHAWLITGTGQTPTGLLLRAGFQFDLDALVRQADPSYAGLLSLDDLHAPLVRQSPEKPLTVNVRPRFAGWRAAADILGAVAVWDKENEWFTLPLVEILKGNDLRAGLVEFGDVAAAARSVRDEALAQTSGGTAAVSALASATGIETGERAEHIAASLVDVAAEVGDVPAWFGLDLYPYQRLGAVAMAAGRRLNCDDMGLGKGSPPETPLLTPTGWSTYGDIKVGDSVVGADGRPTKVTGVYPRGVLPTYVVTFDDGTQVVVDPEHLWTIETVISTSPEPSTTTVPTESLKRLLDSGRHIGVRAVAPVVYTAPSATPEEAFELGEHSFDPVRFAYQAARIGPGSHTPGGFQVPPSVRTGSIHTRASFLAGLWHFAGGTHQGNSITFHVPSLIETSLVEIVGSLGGIVKLEGPRVRRVAHVRLPLALAQWVTDDTRGPFDLTGFESMREMVRRVVSCEISGMSEIICISVAAPDRLYVTTGYVPTHNTRTTIAAHAIHATARLIVVCPPVVLTHWRKEITESGLADHVGGTVVSIVAGRKVPDLPATGVVIVPDSLLSARPALVQQLMEWSPTGMIVDEGHRMKTWKAKRSIATRELAQAVKGPRLVATGTPMNSSPYELVPLLDITGQLGPIFGGHDRFLAEFCRQNTFKEWVARKAKLPALKLALNGGVWVRRIKSEVAVDLPDKRRTFTELDVDLAGFRQAHNEVAEKVVEWLDGFYSSKGRPPSSAEVGTYVRGAIGLMSPLRKAAGLAKVPAAIETISAWVEAEHTRIAADGGFDQPLIVWVHHHEVLDALIEALPPSIRRYAAVISGHTPAEERGRVVEDFQAGKTLVVFCSMHAAGVGVTLTRSSDVLFVETDWDPSTVLQAEDRAHRVTQVRPVLISTLVAVGTLDEHIQSVLYRKGEIVTAVAGGDLGMSSGGSAGGASAVTRSIVDQVFAAWLKRNKLTSEVG